MGMFHSCSTEYGEATKRNRSGMLIKTLVLQAEPDQR